MDAELRTRFQEDGAVLVKNCLDAEQLAACREAFDWAVANPGPAAFQIFDGTVHQTHNDNSNPKAKERLDALVATLPLGKILAELWGSENAWYFAEEVFLKAGGKTGPSPWHQDTSYLPWAGHHWGNAWISFEPLPQKNALGVVRGSCHGPRYDGTTFMNPDDPTEPLHGAYADPPLPRLPDVEANRDAFDIVSYASEPGDVLFLHPGSLHGGAPVDADCPDRHTLVLRFFGDDAVFNPLPDSPFTRHGFLFQKETGHLKAGEPYRSPVFQKVY